MCIQTRIQKAITEKAALDARIAKLEKLEAATAPVKKMLSQLLADFSQEVPEELPGIWEEILAIGAEHKLSVQALTADELREWEADRAALQQLRSDFAKYEADCKDSFWTEAETAKTEAGKPADVEQLIEDYYSSGEFAAPEEVDEVETPDDSAGQLALEFPDPEKAQAEPEEAYDTVESVLKDKGFYRIYDDADYDENAGNYRGWDILLGIPNGGVVVIGLYNTKNEKLWEASTEYIQSIDVTFPEYLDSLDEIVAWTRALIDLMSKFVGWEIDATPTVLTGTESLDSKEQFNELKAWEAANAENERLREEARDNAIFWGVVKDKNKKLEEQLEEAHAEITEQDRAWGEISRAWGEISDERDDLEKEVSELRSQIEQLKIASGLEKLYQEALTENTDVATESIPALTLWQPWATLIQQEIKRVETRSWSTNYRGPIAIHAAKKPVEISGYSHLFELLPDNCEFPLGVVVAIANLVDCVEMTPEFIAQQSEQELKCGDWQPGRFAWVLEIIRPVVPPAPATGGQKVWNWSGTSVSAELEYLEKLKTAPEPEETTGTVDGILESKGFFQPDNFLEAYSSDEKYETYRGWDIYYSLPNGGVVSIGLDNSEYKQAWDASTEYIQEIDATFPESLADYDEIVAWTRALIDRIENLEVPGQLALEFSEPESEMVLTGVEYDAAVEEELALDDDEDEHTEATPTPGLTTLQKLLIDNNTFTFEDLEVSVAVQSVIASADDTVDFESEEALFTVSNAAGRHREYYCDAQYLLRFCRTSISLKIKAEDYARLFLDELTREEKTRQIIASWNVDKVEQASEIAPQPIAKEVETDTDRYRNFNHIFKLQDFKVDVRQHNQGEDFAGASFNFFQDDKLIFSKSLASSECGDKSPKELATEIIEAYWQKLQEKKEREVNPYKKPEDDFIELIRLNPSVGYLKQKAGADAGKILATYIAFANRDAAGNKTETLAKSRAKKWYEHLQSPAFEHCNWKVEEVRKVKRMASQPGDRQQFAYEIKITGKMSIEQIQKLAENDFSLLPEEIGISRPAPSSLTPKAFDRIYQVKINSFQAATGNEQEMRSRFEEELKNLGGSQMSVSLLLGSEVIESYRVADFRSVRISDFDEDNPEFEVTHLPSQKSFKVYRRLNSPPELDGWTNSIYPYSPGFTKREAAAADAVRRLLKADQEVSVSPVSSKLPADPGLIYSVRIDSLEKAKGTKEEMTLYFEEQLEKLGRPHKSIVLLRDFEVKEKFDVADFNFIKVDDFDSDNPEYEVQHLPTQKSFKTEQVMSGSWRYDIDGILSGNTVKPTRESAAADAVRKMLATGI